MIDEIPTVFKEIKDYNIVPSDISTINSRSECNPFDSDGNLPIFCSPMSCVTNESNFEVWEKHKLIPIAPRTINYETRLSLLNCGKWVAFGFDEFCHLCIDNAYDMGQNNGAVYKICIDMSNGHMKTVYEKINEAKRLARVYDYTLVIMMGNIANPETIRWICEHSSVDYIRVNIGTGDVCITAKETGVYYPSGTLIKKCKEIINEYKHDSDEFHIYRNLPKIVCDGGMKNISDIIKALALGADYVMLGSMLVKTKESASVINENNQKEYFGMSTPQAQYLIGLAKEHPVELTQFKMTEGISKYVDVEGSVSELIEKYKAYVRSAMSFTDCMTLEDFTSGYVETI